MPDTTSQTKQDNSNQPASSQPVGSVVGKEVEMLKPTDQPIEEVKEFQVPKEVSSHIQVQKQKPDIPPDLKKSGVTHAPSDQKISDQTNGTTPAIPLTDDQLNEGLKQPTDSSYRWFAEWCLKQLKVAHVHLTKVKGRYIRE